VAQLKNRPTRDGQAVQLLNCGVVCEEKWSLDELHFSSRVSSRFFPCLNDLYEYARAAPGSSEKSTQDEMPERLDATLREPSAWRVDDMPRGGSRCPV
jgi:hypothetical protein